jgi:signal transduction histidine kinase
VDVEELMRELAGLDEQVRRLVKTERRLHAANRTIEKQLHRFEAMSDLALRVSRAGEPEAMLESTLETLLEVLLVDQGVGFLVPNAAALAPAAVKTQKGLEPPPGRSWTAVLRPPLLPAAVFRPNGRGTPPEEDVRLCLDAVAAHLDAGRAGASAASFEVALPLRGKSETLRAIIVLRKAARAPSFHEHSVGEDDLPFLELVASHTGTALENLLLYRQVSSFAAQLEDKVAARTADLAQANEDLARHQAELAEALAFRDQVMGIVGHDLRNPLHAVGLSVASALGRADVSNETRQHLSRIDRAARRMLEMIGTLLDFAHARFGASLPIAPQPMDLDEVVRNAVEELLATNPDRTVRMELGGRGRGWWDPARMAQVASNVIGNAFVHGAKGEPVRVSVSGDGRAVVLDVSNRGPAIPAELMPVLFEPFRRGPAAEKPSRFGGLGLGLYIARHIVLAHGGTITARSNADDGTTFTVSLPRGAPAAATAR